MSAKHKQLTEERERRTARVGRRGDSDLLSPHSVVIVAIHDREAIFQPKSLCFASQNLHAERTEGADGQLFGLFRFLSQ